MQVSRGNFSAMWLVTAALAACSAPTGAQDADSTSGGNAGTAMGGNPGSMGGSPGTVATTISPLLRITQSQYRIAVADLLGVDAADVALPPDGKAGVFSSNAGFPLTLLSLDQYAAAAETLAARAAPKAAELSGCVPKQTSEEAACVRALVEKLASRAYRRLLAPADIDMLVNVFTVARRDRDYTGSVALLLEAVLQAPDFLYRVERGSAPKDGRRPLTSFEMAARLGFLFGDSLPDESLMQAARNGTLNTDDELRLAVDRLWKRPASTNPLTRFHREWLDLDKLDALSKDPKRYPFFDAAARLAMRQEFDAFVDFVMHKGGAHLRTLLSAPIGFPSGSLFRVYGLIEPAGHSLSSPVGMPATQRAGLLTLPAVMATHANSDLTSPVHRGLFIFRNLLCQDLPPPPVGVDVTPIRPDPEGKISRRALFAQHEADPSCGSCHKIVDPIGFAFEQYDAVGSFRTMDVDENAMIDASATIATGTDVDGAVPNGTALIARLAASRDVHDCYVRQWWSFVMGRPVKDRDEPVLRKLSDGFAAGSGDVQSLLVNIVLCEDFRTRQGADL